MHRANVSLLGLFAAASAPPGYAELTASITNVRNDKELRENLSERQIDNMISDSFPASDPPSTF